jgi:hypothetical protein
MGKGGRNLEKRDRQTGEKALDLPARSPALRDEGRAQPFDHETQGLQDPERIDFLVATTIASDLERAHSKALPACR